MSCKCCHCAALEIVECYAVTPPSMNGASFIGVDMSTCTLKVPEGSIAAYQQAEGWKDFANITDLATGIANIQQNNGKDASVYNLNGTRVKDSKKLSKGVYIINERKVMVK